MKTLRNLLTAVAIMMGTLTMNAQSMSIAAIRSNARFLTDRMAYTLGISNPFLIDEIYRINYDYIYGVNAYLDDIALGYYYDDYMQVCDARDIALRNLLGITIWNRLIGYSYFHRPIIFSNHRWHFGIYDHDRYGASYFHYAAPRPFGNGYAGGHFFGGMAPAPRAGRPANGPMQTPGRGGQPGNPPTAPRGDMNANNGRGGTPSVPGGDANHGRDNATPSVPGGGSNYGRGDAMQGGNTPSDRNTPSAGQPSSNERPNRGTNAGSQNNMQSSSRTSSARTSAGSSNSGNVSRGGGSGASRGGSGGGARGGSRR